MAINRPTTKTIISTTGWGIPITDEVNALRTDVNALKATVPWNNVSFQNGWGNQTGMGPIQYRKIGDNIQLRGVMHNGALLVTAFTLPSGYRPLYETYITTGSWSGSAWGVARTRVLTDGTVIPTNGAAGANCYWSLDGQWFSTT